MYPYKAREKFHGHKSKEKRPEKKLNSIVYIV